MGVWVGETATVSTVGNVTEGVDDESGEGAVNIDDVFVGIFLVVGDMAMEGTAGFGAPGGETASARDMKRQHTRPDRAQAAERITGERSRVERFILSNCNWELLSYSVGGNNDATGAGFGARANVPEPRTHSILIGRLKCQALSCR